MNEMLSMSEMHLKQSGFTHSACRSFTKTKQRIQKYNENITKI